MRLTSIIAVILTLICAGCSDRNDEPDANENRLLGLWALTHTRIIEHIGGIHNTTDKEIPPHGYIDAPNDEMDGMRFDVLIFDDEMVTVRCDMPSCPNQSDYDDTPDGIYEYITDLNDWHNSIGEFTDRYAFPVGAYRISNNDLIIGSLNMGRIDFASDNAFTLDYKTTLDSSGDYRRRIYTYTRISTLSLQ